MTTIHDHLEALIAPFHSSQVELKPGAITKDRTRALVMPYADLRVYQERLDQVVGPDNWSVAYQVTNAGVLCALTILGVTKTDVGDWPLVEDKRPDENHLTTAVAQAFKRACATFGVGRFLYNLPKMWADYDDQKRAIVEPQRVIYAPCTATRASRRLPRKTFRSRTRPRHPRAARSARSSRTCRHRRRAARSSVRSSSRTRPRRSRAGRSSVRREKRSLAAASRPMPHHHRPRVARSARSSRMRRLRPRAARITRRPTHRWQPTPNSA